MRYALLFLFLILSCVSCIKDIDTEQVESASFSTPTSLALLQSYFFPNDFLDANNDEFAKINKVFLIDLSEFFYESATDSLHCVTQISNTFNREFICQLEFLGADANGEALLPLEVFTVPALSSNTLYAFTYEGEEFELFTDARWIRVGVKLLDGLPFNPDDEVNLSLQSVIHFNYELEL